MASPVYFMDLRAAVQEIFLKKLDRLMKTAGVAKVIDKRDPVKDNIGFDLQQKESNILTFLLNM